jgi:hypothetical protein
VSHHVQDRIPIFLLGNQTVLGNLLGKFCCMEIFPISCPCMSHFIWEEQRATKICIWMAWEKRGPTENHTLRCTQRKYCSIPENTSQNCFLNFSNTGNIAYCDVRIFINFYSIHHGIFWVLCARETVEMFTPNTMVNNLHFSSCNIRMTMNIWMGRC